jgi:2-dehydro-3-deoxyphosphogalactonate aldolase
VTLDEALKACPVIAVLRGVRPEEVLDHAGALVEAGLRAIEIPLNSPDAFASVAQLAGAFGGDCVCGAGTVLTVAEVERVAAAGGRLIVSPNTSPTVIARAIELGLTPVPGFATATEAFAAIDAGARHLKLFPARSPITCASCGRCCRRTSRCWPWAGSGRRTWPPGGRRA